MERGALAHQDPIFCRKPARKLSARFDGQAQRGVPLLAVNLERLFRCSHLPKISAGRRISNRRTFLTLLAGQTRLGDQLDVCKRPAGGLVQSLRWVLFPGRAVGASSYYAIPVLLIARAVKRPAITYCRETFANDGKNDHQDKNGNHDDEKPRQPVINHYEHAQTSILDPL